MIQYHVEVLKDSWFHSVLTTEDRARAEQMLDTLSNPVSRPYANGDARLTFVGPHGFGVLRWPSDNMPAKPVCLLP